MKYNTARPYVSSFVLLRKQGKIAFVLRSHTGWMDGNYGLPAGKVENNERITQAAIREAKEEAGVFIKSSNLRHALTMHRKSVTGNDDEEDMYWIDVFFEVNKWEGEPYNAEPKIHGEFKWLDPKKLPKNMAPNVRNAIKCIETGKIYAEFGWEDK